MIFEERKNIQPYEYPHLLKYVDAIHESFWTPNHFTYDRDINDFLINLTENERTIIKKAMLAIGVVENKVKTFWARIDLRMPKTEIADVGHTFAGNEVIHKMTYEKLLNLLGLSEEFANVKDIPCMQGRSEYLSKYLQGVYSKSNKEFTKSLILFTLLVENASLFSQFLIVSSFKKHKNVLTNFNSIISAMQSFILPISIKATITVVTRLIANAVDNILAELTYSSFSSDLKIILHAILYSTIVTMINNTVINMSYII